MSKTAAFFLGFATATVICLVTLWIAASAPVTKVKAMCDEIERTNGTLYCKNVIKNEDDVL